MKRTRAIVLAGAAATAIVGAAVAVSFFRGAGTSAETIVSAQSRARAERRSHDGAPPIIPHKPLGGACTSCHAATAREVPGIGVAPPNPHLKTAGLSESANCRQCHVFQSTPGEFVASAFRPVRLDFQKGERLYPHAPPVVPHRIFMRENCASCHTGDACRPEIRCTHPERANCAQCHARDAAAH